MKSKSEFVVVIPARYQSTRLPGKPLLLLSGIPMVVRTYMQCILAVPPKLVFVATDDLRIKAVCEERGIQVVMTSAECKTGTDRVAEVSRCIGADFYINVQGDEPIFNPSDLTQLIIAAKKHPGEVINGYCEIDSESIYRSASVPKAVLRPDGRLLYMSRSPIPADKSHSFIKSNRQVCAYSFPNEALMAFSSSNAKTPLEEIEDIEILRFLELGWDVRMIPMSNQSIAVDNPEDVDRVEDVLRGLSS